MNSTSSSPSKGTTLEHAVVIGGSMAGLLAARVLADHARRVTVLERDDTRAAGVPRKGVPQGVHAHVLLQSGLTVLRSLFADIDQALTQAGGPAYDLVNETAWKIEGQDRPRYPSQYQGYALSRPVLESIVRSKVEALPDVQLRPGTRVSSLMLEGGRVCGVSLASGDKLPADLVVDASGRGTRLPDWLNSAGYSAPRLDRVQLGLSYTSCPLRPGPNFQPGCRMLLVPPRAAHSSYGGLLVPIEQGRYLLTLIAYDGAPRPTSHDELLRCLEQVDDTRLVPLVRACTPLSDPTSFSIPEQRWRRYDKAKLPARLLVVGDALCAFDPAFGQGISVSALEVRTLAELLTSGVSLDLLARDYFQKTVPVIAGPWSMARSRPRSDTRGTPSLLQRYQRAVLRAAAHSPAVHDAFLRVVNLEASPASLLHPSVALRVLSTIFSTHHSLPSAAPLRSAPRPQKPRIDALATRKVTK